MENHGTVTAIAEPIEHQNVIDAYNDFYKKNGYYPKMFNPYNKVEIKDVSPTLTTMVSRLQASSTVLIKESSIAIPEATEKGFKLATDGDGVYLNRPHQKRGTVQKDMMPTLVTNGDDYGVVVKDDNMKTKLVNDLIASGTVQGGEVINHSFTTSENRQELKDYIETNNGISPTLTTRPDVLGYVEQKEISNLRIRKLTPRECWRLMGFSDQMFNRASENQSNASLYHLAGDSIVVDVLMAIFGKLKG
jgi:DNA (cytosine-5)-methyltransferase 1